MNAVINYDEHGTYSIAQAAEIAGINRSTMHRYVFGDPRRGTQPSKVLRWRLFGGIRKGFLLGRDLNKFFHAEIR